MLKKPWFEKYHIVILRNTVGKPPIPLNEKNISPLTHMLLNLHMTNIIQNKIGLIINLPSARLPPISLLSYIISNEFDKSVIIYSLGKDHWNNYYELHDEVGYLWHRIPCGLYQRNQMQFEPMIQKHRVQRDYYAETNFKKHFLEKKKKLLFLPRINRIEKGITKNIKINDKPVLIIENADRIIKSDVQFDEFLEEGKYYSYILIHFVNPQNKYLNILKSERNFLHIHIGLSLISNNKYLKNKMRDYNSYLKNEDYEEVEEEIISNLNLETSITNETDVRLSLDESIPNNRIDLHIYHIISNIESLQKNYNDQDLISLSYLPYIIINSFVPPDELKLYYYDNSINEHKYYDIKLLLIKIFHNLMKIIDKDDQIYLMSIIQEINAVLNLLSKEKRIEQTKRFNFEGKLYRLFKIIRENEEEKIIVATHENTNEKDYLMKYYFTLNNINYENQEYLPQENISFISLKKLRFIANKDIFDTILIIPGHIPSNLQEIFYYQWKKVIILNYYGINYTQCKKMLSNLAEMNCLDEVQSINSLKIFGENSQIIQDFERRCGQEIHNELSNEEKIEEIEEEVAEEGSVFNLDANFLKKNYYLEHLNYSYQRKIQSDNERKEGNLSYIKVKAIREYDKEEFILNLIKEELYYGYDLSEKFIERPADEFKTGFKIIYISRNDKEEIYNEIKRIVLKNISIDLDEELIENWKLALYKRAKEEKSIKEFHRKYETIKTTINSDIISYPEFNLWTKGEVSYTRDPMDLYVIGLLLNDTNIQDNYDIINLQGRLKHKLNINLGRALKKLIPLLNQKTKINELITIDEDQEKLLGLIEHSLYEIT